MFEQMMIDCARNRSFGKLNNASIAKRLSSQAPQPSGSLWKMRRSVQYAWGHWVFPLSCGRPLKSKKVRACGETIANDPETWILKRGDG